MDVNNFREDFEVDDEEGIVRVRRLVEFNDVVVIN